MPILLYVDPMFNNAGLRNVIRHYYEQSHHNKIFPVSDGAHAEKDVFGKHVSVDAVLLGLGVKDSVRFVEALEKKYSVPPLFLCGSYALMKRGCVEQLQNYPNLRGHYKDIYDALKSDPFVQLKAEVGERRKVLSIETRIEPPTTQQ